MIKSLLAQKAFITTWKTNNSGSSGSSQITIPTSSSGRYGCLVDWGDGTTSAISTYDDAAWTHTYPSPGTYTVTIYGTFEGMRFNNTGDRLKLLNVTRWGIFNPYNLDAIFYGCSNLDVTATDTPYMQKVTTINSMFRNCTNLVFNASINKWDISSVTNPAGMFLQCTSFNQPVSNLDFSKATTLGNLFNGCTSFNQDVSGFDTSNVTIMNGMFNGCTSFNQDVSGFNISALTSASNMFLNSGFTRTNYDKLLDSTTGWPSQSPINSGVTFSAGTAKYSAGSPATGRSFLIGTKLWTITDGGAF